MKPRLLIALCAPLLFAGCREKTVPPMSTPLTVEKPEPMVTIAPATAPTPAETVAPMPAPATAKTYRVRGQVVEVVGSSVESISALVVKHENIPDFMPAMEMRLPLANTDKSKSLGVGDKIVFDMNADNVQISNIEKLPPSTALKLAK